MKKGTPRGSLSCRLCELLRRVDCCFDGLSAHRHSIAGLFLGNGTGSEGNAAEDSSNNRDDDDGGLHDEP